jgi:kinesin family protein C1
VGYGQNGSRSVVKKYSFDFDLVFDSNCSQEDVFLEVSALIQSALDGYNVCIFAYGQTGYVLCVQLRHSVGGLDLPIRVLCRSGKTYTMQGMDEGAGPQAMELSADMGIVGRAISHIFAGIEDMRSSGWHFTASLELVEIYNETLRDLLAPVSVRVHA